MVDVSKQFYAFKLFLLVKQENTITFNCAWSYGNYSCRDIVQAFKYMQLFTHNPTLLVIKDLRQLLKTYTIK